MEPFCNAERLFSGLRVVNAQCNLRVWHGQWLTQLRAANALMGAAAKDGSLCAGCHCDLQRAAGAAALDVLSAQPALRAELCTLRCIHRKRKDQLQRFFVTFQLGKAVFCKGCGNNTHGKSPAVPIRNHLCRSVGHKAGPELCTGIRQRSGSGGGSRLVQHAGKILYHQLLRRNGGLKPGGKRIRYVLQLARPPCVQMHHHTGCQLTTGSLFPFRQRKTNRFQNTQALAVLGHAVQIYHLIEWQGCRLTLQAAIAFRAPGALDTYLALDNSLARQKLYLPYG